jgi:hypothetical protein
MANRLALRAPNFRAENHLRRTTYGSGLQVGFQYIRGRMNRQSTERCTPTMADEPLHLRISAHWRRNICFGSPNFASNFRRCRCAVANACARPPCLKSVKNAEWILPRRCTRTKKP